MTIRSFKGRSDLDAYLEWEKKIELKMTIRSFKGRSDPDAYLEWEKKIEFIFDCHNYSEEKNCKTCYVQFTDYAIIWWDQIATSRKRNHERPIENGEN